MKRHGITGILAGCTETFASSRYLFLILLERRILVNSIVPDTVKKNPNPKQKKTSRM